MTHHSARPLEWIQRYEIALNTIAMEQLEAVNQGIRDGLTSVIDGAYQVYELLHKHRADVLLGEGHLSHEDRVFLDGLVKFRMGDVMPNGA